MAALDHRSRARARRTIPATLLALALVVAGCGSAATVSPTVAPAGPVGSPVAASTLPVEVDVVRTVAMRAAGAFVVDVREPDEWAAGHIEGAKLISLGDLISRVSEVPKDRDVVVVCRSGNRSAQGRDILLGAGFTAVTSMAGGMSAWVAAGQPLVVGT